MYIATLLVVFCSTRRPCFHFYDCCYCSLLSSPPHYCAAGARSASCIPTPRTRRRRVRRCTSDSYSRTTRLNVTNNSAPWGPWWAPSSPCNTSTRTTRYCRDTRCTTTSSTHKFVFVKCASLFISVKLYFNIANTYIECW